MPPRKSVVGKSINTAAVESPATSARRVTRRSETPGEFVRLSNSSPKRKSMEKLSPMLKTKPAPLKENISPSKSTPHKRPTRRSTSEVPIETPCLSEDEAEPSPRQSARARKQTARATESWALKKTKEKADKTNQNQAPSVSKDIMPSPKKVAVRGRILDCLDKADVHITTEADFSNLAYEEELNDRKRESIWLVEEDSYDDGRLPDTEVDKESRPLLAAPSTSTGPAAKKTLKRVTKRQSLAKENDNVDMDEDERAATLYELKSAKNGTPKAKRRKLTIDVEDDEEIMGSDLSPSRKPRNRVIKGAFAVAEQRRKKCYCCQKLKPGLGGWMGKHIRADVKDVCSECSEKSAVAIGKELRGSLISQAKEKIKAGQSERDSVEESSSRPRKATDNETSPSAEKSADEAIKQKKTARDKSLEKARAVKAQKTHKSKSMKNLRNQNGKSSTRQRSLSSVIPGIESEHELDAPINNSFNNGRHHSEATSSVITDALRRSRRGAGAGVDVTTEPCTREESGDKMTRANSVLDPSTFYDDDGELMYHVCPYYIKDEHQGLLWGVPQGAKNRKYRKPKPWQWCVKEPSVREGRMGGVDKVCLWEDLEPIREDWWDEETKEMSWLSGFETVRIDRRKLTTPMVCEGSHAEMPNGEEDPVTRRKSKPPMSKEQREKENEKVKSRRGKAPVPESDTWTAMIMDLRRNTQSGEIFIMIAPWWTRDEVKFQLGQFGGGYLNKRWPTSKPWEYMLGAHFEVVPWEALIDRVEARNDPRFCHEMMYGAKTLNYEVFGRNIGREGYNLDGVDLNTEDRALWRSWKRQGSRKGLTDDGRRELEMERDRHEERGRATFAKLFWTRELWEMWLERRRRIDLEPEELEAEDRAIEEAERKNKKEARTKARRKAKGGAESFGLTSKKDDEGNRDEDDEGEDKAFQPFRVKAIWDYFSRHEDDLSFPNGQIITVVEKEDDNWYAGEYTDAKGAKREGIFPKNRVERYATEYAMEVDY